jgi:hypothetical protein
MIEMFNWSKCCKWSKVVNGPNNVNCLNVLTEPNVVNDLDVLTGPNVLNDLNIFTHLIIVNLDHVQHLDHLNI